MILVDTNILSRMTDSYHPQHPAAIQSTTKLRKQDQLIIVPQNLYEFWSVATRSVGKPPAGQNGLGMSTERTSQWIRFFQRRFNLLLDRDDLVERWHNLVRSKDIKGLKSHDARLVAAMQTHGIRELLTFNANDFKNLGVKVLDPTMV